MQMTIGSHLKILILSFTIIASSSSHVSSSRAQIGKCLEDKLTALLKPIKLSPEPAEARTGPMTKIERIQKVKEMLRTVRASREPLNGHVSGRRIFFWPWRPRWYRQRWFKPKRPFGFGVGAGIYGGIGPIGIGVGAGLGGGYRPSVVPGFGGTPGIAAGIGGGLGGGYYPGVGLGIGAGVGAGLVGTSMAYNQPYEYQMPEQTYDNGLDNGSQNNVDPANYPVFPPSSSDLDRLPSSSSNGYENGPSSVGINDRPDHVVGYDRTSGIGSMGYKNNGYLKPYIPINYNNADSWKYTTGDNYESVYGAPRTDSGSYSSSGNSVQSFYNRQSQNPTGQPNYENDYSFIEDRDTNPYISDADVNSQAFLYDRDRVLDDVSTKHEFFADRDLLPSEDKVWWDKGKKSVQRQTGKKVKVNSDGAAADSERKEASAKSADAKKVTSDKPTQ